MSVARAPQFRSQFAQFPPQFFELLPQVGFLPSVRLAFAPPRIALRMLAHQLLGPLPDFVSQIRETGRFEMTGSHLQMLGPFFRRQITLGTGSLRTTPLRTRSPEIGTLRTGTLRTTGAVFRAARTVRTIAQLLQPAFGFIDGPFHLRQLRRRSLSFHQLAHPLPQFIEMPFDLLPLALTHLLHPPAGPHPLGTVSRAAIPRAPVLRTTPVRPPVLHAASFPRTTISRATLPWPAITWARVTWATIARTTIAWAALRTGRTAAVVNQLLLGGQLGLRPTRTGIARWILRQSSQQTNSQSQPQIPRHARSSR